VQQGWWAQEPFTCSRGGGSRGHLCTAKMVDPGVTNVQQWFGGGLKITYVPKGGGPRGHSCSAVVGGGLKITYVLLRFWTQGSLMFSSGWWRAQDHLRFAKVLDPGVTYVQQWLAAGSRSLMYSKDGGPRGHLLNVQQGWWVQEPLMCSRGGGPRSHLCAAGVVGPGAT
jgi:hypothetical protein